MKIELERYIEDIENRLNDEEEQRLLDGWECWCKRENKEGFEAALCRSKSGSRLEWPDVNINDTIGNDDLAIYRELKGVHGKLCAGSPYIHRIRGNFGVGNVASAFGAKPFIMPYAANTLPNVLALGEEKLLAWLEKPLPAVTAGTLGDAFRISERYVELRKRYPKFAKYVRIEQPDLQGPMDNLELLYGSDLFYLFYDEPETVHALLNMVTDFLCNVMDRWLELLPENRGHANYFRHIDAGSMAVRDDSAMNLSPDFYSEFVAPYDGRLLKRYGGIVHFCGRGDHYIDRLSQLEGLKGINMSQPHLNDMEKIFTHTIDRGIHLSISTPPFKVDEKHRTENLIFLDSDAWNR